MPRLLILSASAGAGHNRAAEALHESARVYAPGVETAWVDSLKYTNKVFARLYERSYFWLAGAAPDLWGYLYKKMGAPAEERKLQKVVDLHDRLTYRKLVAHVEEFRPDAVLCTHFLPMAALLAREKLGVPVYVVITDFDAHGLWVHKRAAGYFVASEEVKCQLVRRRFPAERVRVTGIPIHPVFASEIPRPPASRPEILLMGGGFGMGHMELALERLLEIPVPCRITVIAGRNEKMKKRLQEVAGGRAEVHGFVTNIQEFMTRADLAISKSGGLTVSECLARGLPLVVTSPIPGQEEANADYLLEKGAAVKARSLDVLDFKVRELLENPARLDMMKRAAAAAARPFAGRDILRYVLDENPSRG